jgi:hypothetical protein
MATSGRLIDYLGSGLASARPATPTLFAGTLGVYFATDTSVVSYWNGSSWFVQAALTNPMTAVGDLIIGSTAGAPARLAASTNGYVLTLASGAPTWAAPSAATAALGDDTIALATTAFVQAAVTAIPQNSQSTAYTLVLTDKGKHILHPSVDTTARTFTIPANSSVAYAVGTALTFINQNAAGVVTIAITTDTMRLAGAGTTGSRTLAANGIATAIKITPTEWLISGTGLS